MSALQHELEQALVALYRMSDEMFDADALAAVERLIDQYEHGEQEADFPLSSWAYLCYEELRDCCDKRMGRELNYGYEVPPSRWDTRPGVSERVLSAEIISATLHQLHDSITHWQQHALRGYYEFLTAADSGR